MNQLGQLIFTGIKGTGLLPEEKTFIEKEDIGGVILFSQNFESPAQLAELTNQIQTLRKEYPLFIAVDHEGGRVIRFKSHFTQFPSMLDISLTDSPKLCFEMTRIIAMELKACGVNLNLAPVCDIFTNPNNKVIGDRAFGSTEETVSKFITAMIRGLQTHELLSCAKHFPGHGDTSKDSHYDLPYVTKSLDELKQQEFQPFIKAVKARVELIMMAHLVVDAIDKELPTSLSPKAYDIIRRDFKYNKLIITDDMQMKAIEDHFSVEEAAVRAITAGADLIEYRDMEYAQRALEALKEASKTKKLKNTAVTEKLNRILEAKKTYLKEYKPNYIPDISKSLGLASSQRFLSDLNKLIADKKAQSSADSRQ